MSAGSGSVRGMRITKNEVALVAMRVALFSTWYSEFRFSQREIFNSKLHAYSNLLTSAKELYEASLIKNAKRSQRFLPDESSISDLRFAGPK